MFSINPDRLSFRGLSGVSRGINSPSIFDTPPCNGVVVDWVLMKKILLGLGLLFLNGCYTYEENRDFFMKQSEGELCMNYLTLPSWNAYQNYRYAAIQTRNIDCRPYLEQARLRGAREDAIIGVLQGMSNTNRPGLPSYSGPTHYFQRSYVSGTNRICIYKSGNSEKVLTIGAVQSCPLQY